MRGFASYLFLGVLAVLAMDFIAPPVGIGMGVSSWPAFDEAGTRVVVNRSAKGDRLPIPEITVRKPAAPEGQPVLIGCEPAFSPLSVSARLNYPGRCMAALKTANPA